MNLPALVADLRARKVPAIARAISLAENGRPGFEELLSTIHSLLGQARRIGITGPPGAGKSTLTERLVQGFRNRGLTVAIVAVDPTSPFTGGALLGDRIRMESVALDPGVYIRSMATRGSLGGLATTTREVADILDAAGFDRIIVETVGVGQSELDVARTADTTVLVLVPESGDGIQTLKSGVMEIGDIFVVNKADRPGADRMRNEIEVTLGIRMGNALRNMRAHHGGSGIRRLGGTIDGSATRRLGDSSAGPGVGVQGDVESVPPSRRVAESPDRVAESPWQHPVLATVASKGEGTEELLAALDRHAEHLIASGELTGRRRQRLFERTREVIDRATKQWIWQETGAEQLIRDRLDDVLAGRVSPYELAADVLDSLKQGSRV